MAKSGVNNIVGKEGEFRAADYLDGKGFEIIARNYSCRYGEIDIVAMDGETLCFIEVKTRTSTDYGLPCEAVGYRKVQHIKRAAFHFMQRHPRRCEKMRIDVLELLKSGDRYYVRYLQNIGW